MLIAGKDLHQDSELHAQHRQALKQQCFQVQEQNKLQHQEAQENEKEVLNEI